MLGRQETEGVLGKSRKTGFLPDWGQHLSNGTSRYVPGDGWPFRVSKDCVINERLKNSIDQS
jgi:hypothetical protein